MEFQLRMNKNTDSWFVNKITLSLRVSHFTPVYTWWGSLLTNQTSIQEEIKCRLKAGNSCYYSVQTLLSSRLLSKNLKIKIYKTIILPVVLYGCETWSLTLREESRLRLFGNRILRRIFGPKRMRMVSEEGFYNDKNPKDWCWKNEQVMELVQISENVYIDFFFPVSELQIHPQSLKSIFESPCTWRLPLRK